MMGVRSIVADNDNGLAASNKLVRDKYDVAGVIVCHSPIPDWLFTDTALVIY
jgi:hypothetical protein